MTRKEAVKCWMLTQEVTAGVFGSGVAFEHIRFLATVADGINATPELQKLVGYTRPQTSRAVKMLMSYGMVTVEPLSIGHGRRVILTPKANALLDQVHNIMNGGHVERAGVSQAKSRVRK